MAGYHNYSMSNNAVDAYHTGEKPISTGTIIGNWFHLDKGGKKLITANGFRKIQHI